MATEKDSALIQYVISGTQDGTIHWEATAVKDQFTTSFKGKYSVFIDRGIDRDDESEYYWLTMKDTEDRELLKIYSGDQSVGRQLRPLFQLAQRESLNVDSAIDEIIGSGGSQKKLSDEDVPL